MLGFVLLSTIAACAVGAHECFAKAKQIEELRESAKQWYLEDFYELLGYYDRELVSNCGQPITNTEVADLQEELDRLAARIAVYYEGFTAPRLV